MEKTRKDSSRMNFFRLINQLRIERQVRKPEHEFHGARMPILPRDIPGFKRWINCNPFTYDNEEMIGHSGLDFAAYENRKGEYILGLTEGTPVRSILPGKIVVIDSWVFQNIQELGHYHTKILIDHGGGKRTLYIHVKPKTELHVGQQLKAGEIIGNVFVASSEDMAHLAHLHLSLELERDGKTLLIDPQLIFSRIIKSVSHSIIYDREDFFYQGKPFNIVNFKKIPLIKKPKVS